MKGLYLHRAQLKHGLILIVRANNGVLTQITPWHSGSHVYKAYSTYEQQDKDTEECFIPITSEVVELLLWQAECKYFWSRLKTAFKLILSKVGIHGRQ